MPELFSNYPATYPGDPEAPPVCEANGCSRDLLAGSWTLPGGFYVCRRHAQRVGDIVEQGTPEDKAIEEVINGTPISPDAATKHPLEMTGQSTVASPPPWSLEIGEGMTVAPPPPRQRGTGLVLLNDDEFQVMDKLDEAHDIFMGLPQVTPMERTMFQYDLRHVQDRVMRRAAMRAYPTRFDA